MHNTGLKPALSALLPDEQGLFLESPAFIHIN